MPRYRDYTEWDSDRDRRNADELKGPEGPFDDPAVQRRMAEIIARGAAANKSQSSDALPRTGSSLSSSEAR